MLDDSIVPSLAMFLPTLLIVFQNATKFFFHDDENYLFYDDVEETDVGSVHQTLVDMESIVASVLHNFRLQNVGAILLKDLRWWVLPHSTT